MRSRQLGISFLGIIVAGFVFYSQTHSNKKIVVIEQVGERQPASAIEKPVTLQKVNPDHSDVYSFDRRLKAVINKNEVLTDIHYTGYLFVDWVEKSNDARTGIFSFQVKNASTPPVFVEVKVSNDYSLLAMKEPKVSDENEESAILFLKDLVSIYAFKTFEDTTGKYSGSLKMISEGKNGRVWVKKKIKYEESTLTLLKFNQSVHELHVAQKLDEASGLEETQMGNDLKTHGVYLLKRISTADLMKNNVQKIKLDLTTPLMASSLKTNPNKTVQNKVSWDVMEKNLSLIGKSTGKARLNLFHEIVKAMKSNPDKLQDFMQWMKSGLADHEKVSMGIGILATVGSAEAQHELVQMYDQAKTNSPDTAHMVLNSFATSGNKLSPEVTGMLNTILESGKDSPDLVANAAYALGASGDVKKIAELAAQTTSKDEKIVFIDAMGNSGSTDSLPFLLESAQSADPQIREKAVFALRFVNDERVKTVFEQSMSDTSMGVRYSAVKAVPFQANPHDYEAMLKNCSVQAQDKNLKSLCSQTLVNL